MTCPVPANLLNLLDADTVTNLKTVGVLAEAVTVAGPVDNYAALWASGFNDAPYIGFNVAYNKAGANTIRVSGRFEYTGCMSTALWFTKYVAPTTGFAFGADGKPSGSAAFYTEALAGLKALHATADAKAQEKLDSETAYLDMVCHPCLCQAAHCPSSTAPAANSAVASGTVSSANASPVNSSLLPASTPPTPAYWHRQRPDQGCRKTERRPYGD